MPASKYFPRIIQEKSPEWDAAWYLIRFSKRQTTLFASDPRSPLSCPDDSWSLLAAESLLHRTTAFEAPSYIRVKNLFPFFTWPLPRVTKCLLSPPMISPESEIRAWTWRLSVTVCGDGVFGLGTRLAAAKANVPVLLMRSEVIHVILFHASNSPGSWVVSWLVLERTPVEIFPWGDLGFWGWVISGCLFFCFLVRCGSMLVWKMTALGSIY